MTQDEIIAMARQAGFDFNQMSNNLYTVRGNYAQLEAFVNLVADKEREACAKLVDELPAPNVYSDSDKGMWDITSLACGDAIRARGEQA